jgi:hypothetical protein
MPAAKPDTGLQNVTPLRRTEAQWEALAAENAPRVPWDVFNQRFDWQASQHVGLIGPNGQGKTTLLTAILKRRRFVALFATKPRDKSLEALVRDGDYDLYQQWLNIPAQKSPRRVIWPDARDMDAEENQKKVFDEAFQKIFREGHWCLANDEGWYISEVLGLKKRMRTMWTQARSLGISYVVGTQRPAWVPIEMYDESHHLFIWRLAEREALSRVSSLGGADTDLAKWVIRRLERHQCLYINTRTGEMMRTRAPELSDVPALKSPPPSSLLGSKAQTDVPEWRR